jgi:hypothetical protein
METIKLETNIPAVVALAFSEGKPVESQYTGSQVMFSLVDGRRMYLPPIVADKIKQAGITARVPFEIVKKQVGRSIEYQIRNHNNTAGMVSETAPALVQVARAANQSAPQGYANGNGHRDQAMAAILNAGEAAMAKPAPAAPLTRTGAKLMAALAAAVEAVIETEAYCARQGRDFSFTSEDVRALAITVYISDCKGGGA